MILFTIMKLCMRALNLTAIQCSVCVGRYSYRDVCASGWVQWYITCCVSMYSIMDLFTDVFYFICKHHHQLGKSGHDARLRLPCSSSANATQYLYLVYVSSFCRYWFLLICKPLIVLICTADFVYVFQVCTIIIFALYCMLFLNIYCIK